MLGFAGGQDPAAGAVGTDQFAHHLGAEDVAAHPIECLEVSQAAFALFDVGLDQEGAVAVAPMSGVALGLFGDQESAGAVGAAEGHEALAELGEQTLVAGQQARVDHGGADHHVALGVVQAVFDRAGGVADLEPEVP